VFLNSVASWLGKRGVLARAVISAKIVHRHGGSCETCSYEYEEFVIMYVGADGDEHLHTEVVEFADLIQELAQL
jgi:hypothetical protein